MEHGRLPKVISMYFNYANKKSRSLHCVFFILFQNIEQAQFLHKNKKPRQNWHGFLSVVEPGRLSSLISKGFKFANKKPRSKGCIFFIFLQNREQAQFLHKNKKPRQNWNGFLSVVEPGRLFKKISYVPDLQLQLPVF